MDAIPRTTTQRLRQMVEWARQFVAALDDTLQVEAAREGSEVILRASRARDD